MRVLSIYPILFVPWVADASPRYGHYQMLDNRQTSGNVSFGNPSVLATSPYDHDWIESYTALGDSYAVGLGAGHAVSAATGLELNSDCYQYSYGYPNLLNMYEMIGINPSRKFQYLGCSGAQVGDIQSKQVAKMQSSQLVTLSAGGNDANLATILNYCIYQWATWWWPTCDGQLSSANETINDAKYTTGLTNLINAITPKLQGSNARVYWVGYPRFFDTTTNECDSVTWAFTRNYLNRQYLTQDRRLKMNGLVDNVNAKIQAVCGATSQCVYVAMEDDIQTLGGHFCEPGVDESYTWGSGGISKDREETWFYEWGTMKDDDTSQDKSIDQPERRNIGIASKAASLQSRQTTAPDTPTVNGTDAPDGLSFEASLLYFMQIGLQNNSINIANYSNNTNTGLTLQPYDSDNITLAGSILPDSYGRIFHLNKFANGDVALRILDAMDAEQAKMMSQPLPTTTISICTSLEAATTTAILTTTTPASAPSACVGNQIEGSCTMGALPSSTPDGGPLSPVCNKVDTSSLPYLMFNATQASQGAGQYCANLVSNKIVLDASNTSPAPGNVPNGAENGGSISFTVLFDVDSCDPGTSSDDQKLDFGALGEQQCYTLLYTQLAMECTKDNSWPDYDPNYSLEGGIYGASCALWSMDGLPAGP